MIPRRARITFTGRGIPESATRLVYQSRLGGGSFWTMEVDLAASERHGDALYGPVRLLSPQARSAWLEPGTHFELVEGPRVVAAGVVLQHQARRTLQESPDVERAPRYLEEAAA